jgi:DHA1 family multidrug resistance protein-like MFS transporter
MGENEPTENTLTEISVELQEGDSRAEAEHDGHPHWRMTLYAMWVAQLCAMVGFAFAMPFIPFYVRDLGVTDEAQVAIWAGLLSTGSGLMMSLMAPVWGTLADRYGRKVMVQRAMFGGAIILSSMYFVQNVRQLFALRVFQGAVTGTVAASVAMVSSVVPTARLGYSLGLMQTAVFVGNSFGPLVGGAFAESFGYRAPFLVTGVLLLGGGTLVLLGARERFRRPARHERSGSGSLLAFLTSPGILVLLVVYTLMNLGGSFVGPIFPLFVEQVIGKPEGAASATGLLLAVQGLTSAAAAVTTGRLSDRWGHKSVLVTCTALSGVLAFPHVFAQSLPQLLLLRAAVGLGTGGMVPAMNAMVASSVSRSHLGKAYGFTSTASAFGWAMGPMLGGWAAAALGLRMPFAIMGGLLILMAGVAHRGIRVEP